MVRLATLADAPLIGNGSDNGLRPHVEEAFDVSSCAIRAWLRRRGIAARFHENTRYSHASLNLASILIWLRT